MSPNERDQWEFRLKSGGYDAINALLDRVERLEAELAADHASLLPLLAARDRALARVVELEAELAEIEAATRGMPPCSNT